ncbi:hypothetical protein [Halosaccharopolyspora lacisalsi]|nr:hypothetical protein [Halosaccharopolyspora lacisalsi]
MSPSVIGEEVRAVEVEHGCFYFGNWPQDTGSDPFEVEESASSIMAYADEGIGFFSECGDEDDVARVLLRFLDQQPEQEDDQAAYGEFVISDGDELALATLMMAPSPTIEPPFRGKAGVRVVRIPSVQQPPWVEMEGDTHPVSEDWVVEIWPSGGCFVGTTVSRAVV